jgi:hypothetical protein
MTGQRMHYWGISFAINSDMDKDNAVNFGGNLYHSDTQPNHLINEVRVDDNKEFAKGTFHYRSLHNKHKLFPRP